MKDRSILYWAAEYFERGLARDITPEEFNRYMHFALNVCQSPIEQKMLAALMCLSLDSGPAFVSEHDENGEFWKKSIKAGHQSLVMPQAHLLRYRADFLCVMALKKRKPALFVVECDGHEFHERTKEQAQRDKQRDRDIQALGVPVLRFTGSEIYRDIRACSDQISAFMLGHLKRASAA